MFKKLIILIMLPYCALTTIPLTARMSHKPEKITLKIGQTYRIELPSNPTTGYSWYFSKPIANNSIVVIKDSGYIPKKTKLIGSGGKKFWDIYAHQPGTIRLRLEYKRVWEKKIAPAQVKEFIIRVE